MRDARQLIRITAVLTALTLGLAACGGDDEGGGDSGGDEQKSVADKKDLKLGDATAAIRYYGFACHTDGDLYVHFPDTDVLQTGDTF